MFVKIKAYGVNQFVKSTNSYLLDTLKAAPDFEVELDENGDIKLYSGKEVSEIVNPSSEKKADLAETLGVKKTTRKSTK